MAVLIGEAHLADRLDAGPDGIARRHVDGPEHAHFQVGSWISHAVFVFGFVAPAVVPVTVPKLGGRWEEGAEPSGVVPHRGQR